VREESLDCRCKQFSTVGSDGGERDEGWSSEEEEPKLLGSVYQLMEAGGLVVGGCETRRSMYIVHCTLYTASVYSIMDS
jgi:hypothetical protein